ncbi:hypothetical protein IQ266_07075 [filamentous cyanobacterium LEGE 11480]|uniref:Uncharacterized protein n=1 Tax=Romeriopsis navalis LEGE 11480 TaxID=2777977 RepID=A0A928Z2G7_9CYAN|nr:HpsJ family protein [Romeriopsis navalis]MBE9029524.1 hypothetical protein [Romeriopsis navalis LEGE 11480]
MATSVSASSYSAGNPASQASNGKSIFRIVGIACMAGFLFDILILLAPPNPGALEWRMSFVQQVGDRSIVFMLGIAFLTMGAFDLRPLLKKVAMTSMIVGLIFCLLVPLSIRDSIVLQKQVNNRITAQASQLETQIQATQSNPKLKQKPTDDQIKQALEKLSTQSDKLQQNATKSTVKAGASSVSNLLVTGLALIGLGRYGMRRR